MIDHDPVRQHSSPPRDKGLYKALRIARIGISTAGGSIAFIVAKANPVWGQSSVVLTFSRRSDGCKFYLVTEPQMSRSLRFGSNFLAEDCERSHFQELRDLHMLWLLIFAGGAYNMVQTLITGHAPSRVASAL